jgi:hypothetical protein
LHLSGEFILIIQILFQPYPDYNILSCKAKRKLSIFGFAGLMS